MIQMEGLEPKKQKRLRRDERGGIFPNRICRLTHRAHPTRDTVHRGENHRLATPLHTTEEEAAGGLLNSRCEWVCQLCYREAFLSKSATRVMDLPRVDFDVSEVETSSNETSQSE